MFVASKKDVKRTSRRRQDIAYPVPDDNEAIKEIVRGAIDTKFVSRWGALLLSYCCLGPLLLPALLSSKSSVLDVGLKYGPSSTKWGEASPPCVCPGVYC